MEYRTDQYRWHRQLVGLVTVLCLVGIGWWGLKRLAHQLDPFGASLDPVTDLAKYTSIREMWEEMGLAGYLPQSIPKTATDVTFHYQPGFMQGGSSLDLRMSLPQDDIERLAREFESKAKAVIPPGGTSPIDLSPKSRDWGGYMTVYVLEAESTSDETSFRWNHGREAGAAISTECGVVHYWCDAW